MRVDVHACTDQCVCVGVSLDVCVAVFACIAGYIDAKAGPGMHSRLHPSILGYEHKHDPTSEATATVNRVQHGSTSQLTAKKANACYEHL